MSAAERDPRWEQLTAPFPPDWIEKLPKVLSKQDQRKGRCRADADGQYVSADGHYCGGWHSRAVHLDYVGHAGITMRLNDVVGPEGWDWQPVAHDENGLPLASRGEFWIWLTILGVTKLGVGDDFNGSSKQAIGDALRNAAMRFGIGTYLWSKSDAAHALAARDDQPPEQPAAPLAQATPPAQPPANGNGAGPRLDGNGFSPEAQALADTAKRIRSLNSLKGVHDEATRKHLLRAPIASPLTGEAMTLHDYIQERKTDLQVAANDPANDGSPA